jgi:fructuronate reductase
MHQCIADPDISAFLDCLWDEAEATLRPVPGLDVSAYRKDLRQRFANAALGHRTRQIAMDGSQKLPQRLLSSIRARLHLDLPSSALSLSIAAWMRGLMCTDEAGRAHTVDDPMSARLNALTKDAGGNAARLVRNLSSIKEIFDIDLPSDPRFIVSVETQLATLLQSGVRSAVKNIAASRPTGT